MKIFSASQIKACDAYTIHASGISSAELMERAAGKCVEWIGNHFSKDSLFVVLCGTGNNGGDGLAITRMLHQSGYGVKAFHLQLSDTLSKDCQTNLERLKMLGDPLIENVFPDTFITDIPSNVIIIDAIFGTGLNRPVEGWVKHFIQHINDLPNRKLAIDLPSGMHADSAGQFSTVLQVNDTLSFQFYKRAFLHAETGKFAGNIHILNIDLDAAFINATHTNYRITNLDVIRTFYKKRAPFSHKGTYGTALLIGGSKGMIGAIGLSVRASLRAGAGKVKCLVPECGYAILQTIAPEAMCNTSGEQYIEKMEDVENADAVGVGPGLGTNPETGLAFEAFLNRYKSSLVVDADALNLIAANSKLLKNLPANTILTPHPKEFERIFGVTADSMLRVELARVQAMRYNIIIILKDRYSVVVTPDGTCWYNITGNAGLASGGTGDILTGIITALLAQGYEPVQAAQLGAYIHGLAADIALAHQSAESMIASDVTASLGKAFKEIQ